MKRALLKILILLACSLQLSAQVEQIAGKLNEYCSRVPWEEINIHTDRETYIAGEDIWLKMYSFERHTGKPSKSTIAYFELLSYDNRPVIRKRIRLEAGSGPGHITLPDTLSTGVYTIRAYTNMMKNFMPDNCFMKQINIYSALGSGERKITAGRVSVKSNSPGQRWQLDVENDKPDSIIISVAPGIQERTGQLFILIHNRGIVCFAEKLNISDGRLKLPLNRKLFSRGILHITLFSNTGVPLAERFVYSPGRNENLLSVSTSVESFGIREKVGLNMEGIQGDFSVSVSPYCGNSSDIADYLVYGSEFGSAIQQAFCGVYLDDLQVSYIDSLLAETHSSWISWDRVLSGKVSENRYHPEVNEHFLKGSLVNGNPSDKFVIMSIPGKEAYFQYSVTDADGNFNFSIPADYEQRTLIIQPDELNGGSMVRMGSSFMEDYQQSDAVTDSSLPVFPGNWSTNYQVSRIYGTVFSAPPARIPINSKAPKRFYGKPDVELILDDYIKLPVMEEIFFEIIPGASLKKRRTGYEITIADPVTNTIFSIPPSLFVDGVRIDNADIIANIDPELVEKIDVVMERYMVGDYLFNGIVNVITKRADLSSIELPGYALRTRYRVFDPVSEFASPSYYNTDAKKGRIPDFRNTLYWNPSVVLKAGESRTLEFWSSDVPGEYEINVQGLTSDGRPVNTKKIITIR